MKKYLKVIKKEHGFTLVEVLMAIAIVAVAGAALIGMMATSSKILNVANADETARDYAQAQMENVQNQTYSSIDDGAAHDDLYATLADSGGYTITVTASPVEKNGVTQPDTGLQKITVNVEDASTSLFTLEGYKYR